ncbi:hypothetical protein [Streptomyces sp. f51]|uniref:hypothetical protein n=1 Tax=Streptomyces sp. f51 TaxID=1827742 RepID=UPI00211D1C8D|nr:hypothetical protein [Streptomyces sp. f51]
MGRRRAAQGDHQRPLGREPALHWRRSSDVASAPRNFLRNRKQEWEEYRSEAMAFELKALLPVP